MKIFKSTIYFIPDQELINFLRYIFLFSYLQSGPSFKKTNNKLICAEYHNLRWVERKSFDRGSISAEICKKIINNRKWSVGLKQGNTFVRRTTPLF